MVKPLADILSEIEERQPVRRFQAGGMGGPDEDPGTEEGSEIGDSPTSEGATEEGEEGVDYSDQGETVDINWDEFVGLPPQYPGDVYADTDPREKDPMKSIIKNIDYDKLQQDAKIVSLEEQKLAEEEGKDDGTSWIASFIESLISILSLGAIDVQLDKGDKFGPDISTGKVQPQGSVQLAFPSIGPIGTVLSTLGPTVQLGGTDKEGKTLDPEVTYGAERIYDEGLAMYNHGLGQYFS